MGATLSRELQERFEQAGIIVEDAKFTHLAYAPEIAGVMLRRQQAEAIIAARQKIVTGAVSMVEMALQHVGGAGEANRRDGGSFSSCGRYTRPDSPTRRASPRGAEAHHLISETRWMQFW